MIHLRCHVCTRDVDHLSVSLLTTHQTSHVSLLTNESRLHRASDVPAQKVNGVMYIATNDETLDGLERGYVEMRVEKRPAH